MVAAPASSAPAAANADSLLDELRTSKKTILVLGNSYGGGHGADRLIERLPPNEGWRVVLVDRSSHFQHVYIFPRVALLPEHAPKAFIPIAGRVKRPHAFVQATLFNLSPTHATLLSAGSAEPVELPFKYLLYALGGALPAPISLLTGNGSKKEGVGRLSLIRQKLDTIAAGRPDGAKQGRVLVIGGGALGIQFSTDIKSLFPQMEVTLLHSRERMMTSFNGELHDQVVARLEALDIKLILGQRAIVPPEGFSDLSLTPKVVTTTGGTAIPCDLVLLCTGQIPNSHHLLPSFPSSVNPSTKLIHVLPTTQIATGPDLADAIEDGRWFAAGDCCDTGAIQAGYTSWNQAEIAADNIVALATAAGTADIKPALQMYTPDQPQIKLTLGLTHVAIQDGTGTVDLKDVSDQDVVGAKRWWSLLGAEVGKWDA